MKPLLDLSMLVVFTSHTTWMYNIDQKQTALACNAMFYKTLISANVTEDTLILEKLHFC